MRVEHTVVFTKTTIVEEIQTQRKIFKIHYFRYVLIVQLMLKNFVKYVLNYFSEIVIQATLSTV